MLDRTRSYARTHRPRRVESKRFGAARAAAALLATIGLALLNLAFARDGASQIYVRLPAEMPAAVSQRLVSALRAQLTDLVSIELAEPDAERALGIVSIAEAAGALSIQFADARSDAIGAPRMVSGAASERSASEVASIVRAFVVARLDHARTSAGEAESRAPALQDERGGAAAPEPAPAHSAKPAGKEAPQPAPAAALLAVPPAPEAPRATDTPVPAPATQRRVVMDRPEPRAAAEAWRLRLLAAYTGTTYAPELRWHDGLRVDASARAIGPFYLGASYGYQPGAEVVDSDTAVHIRVGGHALSAFAGLGRTRRRFGVAVDAGLGALKTLRETTHTGSGLQKNPEVSYWNLVAALRLHARLRFPAAPRLALDLAPALESAPGAGEAVVETPAGGESGVLSPRSWRARVDIGAAFDVF